MPQIRILVLAIAVLVMGVIIAIGTVLPTTPAAQADFKVSQANFVLDCNTATTADFGGGFSGDGAIGTVTVPTGTQLEVFNFVPAQGVITVDCTVTLGGEDSELNLAEGTHLLFQDGGGAYKNFSIIAAGAGFEIEVQVKKNSRIEAQNLTVNISGAEEAEAQFEENFCLILHGNLSLTMNTIPDEGGDVQFKKFDAAPCDGVAGSPNIDVDGDITLSVGGAMTGDAEIQIEESNYLQADSITVIATGPKSQVQTKKDVKLEALDGDILLSALGFESEVQAEETNIFDADEDITLEVGGKGKLEVKKFSVFTAGGDINIAAGADPACKIEADITAWSASQNIDGDCVIA